MGDDNPFDNMEFIMNIQTWILSFSAPTFRENCMREGLIADQQQLKKLQGIEKANGESTHNQEILNIIQPQEQDGYIKLCRVVKRMNLTKNKKYGEMIALLPADVRTAAEAVPGPAAAAATAATAAVTAPKTGGYGSRLLKDVDDLGELAGRLGNSLGEVPRQHLGKEAVRLTGGKPGDAAATLNEYLSNHESEIEGKKVVINVHVILKFLAASVDKNGGDITLQQLEDLLTHKKVAPQSSRTFQDLLAADDLFDD